jgi:hypothetical protein
MLRARGLLRWGQKCGREKESVDVAVGVLGDPQWAERLGATPQWAQRRPRHFLETAAARKIKWRPTLVLRLNKRGRTNYGHSCGVMAPTNTLSCCGALLTQPG